MSETDTPYYYPVPYQIPENIDERLQEFQLTHEINPKFMDSIRVLGNYNIVYILDDSGSMSSIADTDCPQNGTRWFELQQSVKVILEAHKAVGLDCDVYFLNRGVYRNVIEYSQIEKAFVKKPSGYTNIVKTLHQVFLEKVKIDDTKPVLIHIFTDGHPTNDSGYEDMRGLQNWLTERRNLDNTFISFILCTDDEEIEAVYRPMEYRVAGRMGWNGATMGIVGVDVSEDYRGETRDVRRFRGPTYPFSYGDFIVKCLVGCIDPVVHMIDLPDNYSPYGVVGGGVNNNNNYVNNIVVNNNTMVSNNNNTMVSNNNYGDGPTPGYNRRNNTGCQCCEIL